MDMLPDMLPGAIDRLFLRFCRTGDAKALGRVFDRTAPELLRVALYLSGNAADAEDLVQRTFLAAIESRRSYDPRRRALPWLCGILANHARRLLRERERRAAAATRDDVAPDPAAAAAASELAARVLQVREELGPQYREVLALHLEQGLESKEIAARLGRPAGTVRTQLMRALRMLRERLPGGFVAAWLPGVPAAGALAKVKTTVLAHASASGGVTVGAVVVSTGAVMGSKLAVVVPVFALAAGMFAWAAWPRSE